MKLLSNYPLNKDTPKIEVTMDTSGIREASNETGIHYNHIKTHEKEDKDSRYFIYHQIRIPQPDPSDGRGYSTDHNAHL